MTMQRNLFKSGELVWDAATTLPAVVIEAYIIKGCPRYDLYYWSPPVYGGLTHAECSRGIDEFDLAPLNTNMIKKLRADGHLSNT